MTFFLWMLTIGDIYDGDVRNKKHLLSMLTIKFKSVLAGAAAFAVVLSPFTVQAHQTQNGQPRKVQTQAHSHKHQNHKVKLNLTAAQKQQLRDIEKETHDKIQAVYTPEQLAQLKAPRQRGRSKHHDRTALLNLTDAQKAQIEKIKQEQKVKMDAVLTSEQKQLIEQMHSSRSQTLQNQQ